MIVAMREIGFAIQDAAILERPDIHKTKVQGKACYRVITKRSKTSTPINNVIPKCVGDELLQIPNENKRYVFWSGNGQPKSAVTYDQMDDYIAAGWAKRSRSTAKEKPTHAKRVG